MNRRRGFTLIEVLIVIAIIIILVGIAVVGIGKVIGGGKENQTRTTLANLRSMLSEYEVVSKGLKRQPGMQWLNGGDAGTYSIWQDADPGDGGNAPEPDPALAPGNVTREMAAGNANGRYSADQIGNTQLVLGMMQQAPAVRTMLAQLPAQQQMEEIPAGMGNPPGGVKLRVQLAGGAVGPYTGAAARPSPALVLDGWGNPIIFVPGGGLAGPAGTPSDPTTMIIGGGRGDSDAKVVVALDPATNPGANQARQIRSPDNRPFWASAGPDGDFLTADDNLYSFESQ